MKYTYKEAKEDEYPHGKSRWQRLIQRRQAKAVKERYLAQHERR